VESGCITLDELRETRVELDATNRQVEILSDALAESRQQRPWVGLVDTDIGDEYVRMEIPGGFNRFEYAARAIEAKLKELNT
jgi:hypothetical protein